jgi:hypothetical protein
MADKQATIYEPIATDVEVVTIGYSAGAPANGSIVVRLRTTEQVVGTLARSVTLDLNALPQALKDQLLALALQAAAQAATELGF